MNLVITTSRKAGIAFLSLGALVLSLSFTSCSSSCPSAEAEGPVLISGTVTNPIGDSVYLSADGKRYSGALTEGQFSLKADIQNPGKASLKIGQEFANLYLHPGDDMNLTIDLEQFDETVFYTGLGAERNNYLAAKLLDDEKHSPEGPAASLDEAGFLEAVNNTRERHSALLSAFKTGNPCADGDFLAAQDMDIEYSWAQAMLTYEAYHRYYAKDESFEASANFFDFLADVDMTPEGGQDSETFMRFAGTYAEYLAEKAVNEESSKVDLTTAKLDAIDESFASPGVKNELYAEALTSHLRYYGADGVAPLYERFKGVCDDAECVARVEEVYDTWKDLVAGHKAPTWTYEDIEGQLVGLEDMKGKVVYVDVWATWCGPCRRELPYLEEMQAELASRDDIVFTSVSIDENKEAWENMVVDKNMQGVQLYAKEAWKSEIVKDYAIDGIPRFIVVDKEGNIGSANAPRPSSGEVEEMLLELADGAGE